MKDAPDSGTELLDDFDRRLLRSTALDEPADGALERAGTALGLASTLIAVQAAGAVAAATPGTSAKGWLLALTWKPFLLGAGIGAFVALGAVVVSHVAPTQGVRVGAHAPPGTAPAEPAAPESGLRSEATAPARSPGRTEVALPASGRELGRPPARASAEEIGRVLPDAPSRASTSPLGSVAAFPLEAPAPLESASAGPAGPSSIAEQIRSVDVARDALRSGRPALALVELEGAARRWPDGALATEVRVLHVQALLALGQHAAAVAEARAFLATQPPSSYAARIRALFSADELP